MRAGTRRFVAALALLAAAGAEARGQEAAPPAPAADVLRLKDGRRLEGSVLAETPDGVTFRSGGTTRLYAASDVEALERGAAPSAPATAEAPSPGVPAPPAPERRADDGRRPRVLTDASRAWVRELAKAAESEDDQVRRSVAAALRALGPAAVPAVREAAAAAAAPAARELLERVAADLAEGRRGRKDAAPDAPAGAAADDAADPPMDGTAPPPAAPGPRAGGRRAGGFEDRLLGDLALRDDQLPAMREALRSVGAAAFRFGRDLRSGAADPDAAAKDLDAARAAAVEAAKSVLDADQLAKFTARLERHVAALTARAKERAAADPPAPSQPDPAAPAAPEGAPPAR